MVRGDARRPGTIAGRSCGDARAITDRARGDARRPGAITDRARGTARVGAAARRTLVVAAIVAAIGRAPAFADPTHLVTPPAGWRSDPEQATALAQRFAATSHFGGLSVVTAAEAYVADSPGIALFATRATATLAPPAAPASSPAPAARSGDAAPVSPAASSGDAAPSSSPAPSSGTTPASRAQLARLARTALDELRATSTRAALTGGSADEHGWHEQVDPERRQVTATLAWTDTASHTVETARVVVASDGRRIVAVTGECLAGEAADRAVSACRAALAMLDPGVPAASRVALELAAATAGDAAAMAGDAAATTDNVPRARSASMSSPPGSARFDDGTRVILPPTTIQLDPRPADRRPVYVGAGVVVLAVMLWWSRRRRDRFEREERHAGPAHSPRGPAGERDEDTRGGANGSADGSADDDGDDLHAAARGDARTAQPPSRDDRQS
jgi:hypothetical protein